MSSWICASLLRRPAPHSQRSPGPSLIHLPLHALSLSRTRHRHRPPQRSHTLVSPGSPEPGRAVTPWSAATWIIADMRTRAPRPTSARRAPGCGARGEDRVQHGLPRPVDGDIAAPPPSSSASGVSRLCSAPSRRLPSPKPRRSCRPNRWLAVYLSRKKLAGIKFHWRHLNNYIAVMNGIMSSNRY